MIEHAPAARRLTPSCSSHTCKACLFLNMLGPDLAALLSSGPARFFVTTILPVWVFGLFTGLLFPRQEALSSVGAFVASAVASAVSMGTRSTLLSQIMMFVNGAMFIQSLWYRCAAYAPRTLAVHSPSPVVRRLQVCPTLSVDDADRSLNISSLMQVD